MKYCLSVLLMLFTASAHAELHKWVDSAGNVHYSDSEPPADARVEQVHIPAAAPTPDKSAGKSVFEREADLEKSLKEKQKAEQEAAQKQQEADARKKDCESVRNNLQVLENTPRIATYDANGNRTLMDDAARQQQIEETRKKISELCD